MEISGDTHAHKNQELGLFTTSAHWVTSHRSIWPSQSKSDTKHCLSAKFLIKLPSKWPHCMHCTKQNLNTLKIFFTPAACVLCSSIWTVALGWRWTFKKFVRKEVCGYITYFDTGWPWRFTLTSARKISQEMGCAQWLTSEYFWRSCILNTWSVWVDMTCGLCVTVRNSLFILFRDKLQWYNFAVENPLNTLHEKLWERASYRGAKVLQFSFWNRFHPLVFCELREPMRTRPCLVHPFQERPALLVWHTCLHHCSADKKDMTPQVLSSFWNCFFFLYGKRDLDVVSPSAGWKNMDPRPFWRPHRLDQLLAAHLSLSCLLLWQLPNHTLWQKFGFVGLVLWASDSDSGNLWWKNNETSVCSSPWTKRCEQAKMWYDYFLSRLWHLTSWRREQVAFYLCPFLQ